MLPTHITPPHAPVRRMSPLCVAALLRAQVFARSKWRFRFVKRSRPTTTPVMVTLHSHGAGPVAPVVNVSCTRGSPTACAGGEMMPVAGGEATFADADLIHAVAEAEDTDFRI